MKRKENKNRNVDTKEKLEDVWRRNKNVDTLEKSGIHVWRRKNKKEKRKKKIKMILESKCMDEKKNMSTIFSQKIINDKLLLVVTSGKKKLSDGFKLKPVTTYHLKFVVKML